MSTFKSPKSVLLSAFLLSAAMVSAGVASAADPMPAAPKAEAPAPKAEGKSSKTKSAAGKAKAAATSEVTLKGEMTCAKCGLHESTKCQNVLKVKEASGKEVKYYLAKNATSDDNHEKVCSGSSPATVTGKVSDEGGKKMMTASAVKYGE